MKSADLMIKVCGMRDAQNIQAVEALGIDLMGFIFYPKSPRYVAHVPAYLPQNCKKVGVFVNSGIDDILSHIADFALDAIQLHGDETPDFVRLLRKSTGAFIFKAIGLRSNDDIKRTEDYVTCCDAFVFDTPTSAYGGSGMTFDWSLLEGYRAPLKFLLSGGIGEESLSSLLRFSHPQLLGLDLNSRFEVSPALKDTDKLNSFIKKLYR